MEREPRTDGSAMWAAPRRRASRAHIESSDDDAADDASAPLTTIRPRKELPSSHVGLRTKPAGARAKEGAVGQDMQRRRKCGGGNRHGATKGKKRLGGKCV